jgi:hypothetical protein
MSTIAATNLKNAGSASNNVVLNADGTTTIAAPSNIIKSGTSVATTSGTAIDFTGIPSWVKRVTVMFNGVSTNGTSSPQVQLGAGSITTSGYNSFGSITGSAASATGSASSGIVIYDNSSLATNTVIGNIVIANQSGNTWIANYVIVDPPRAGTKVGGGVVTLSGTLDRLRLTTVNGTDTFDAGSVNILFEG